MRKEATATGVTIEEARINAIRELGIDLEQTDVELITEIIDQPEKKVLGLFGGKPAKVMVYYENSPADVAADYLRNIISGMGIENFSIKTEERNDGAVFTLEGENLGIVIGRRGETLDAVQYLVGLVANRANNSYYRISINTGNYREKRENTIEGLAKKTAFRAIKTGKNIALEPMNPYERRIIHTAVQDIDGASSWSIGEDNTRHVVIGPTGVNENLEGESYISLNRNHKQGGNKRYNNNRGGKGGYNNRSSGYGNNNRGGYNKNRKPYQESEIKPANETGVISDVDRTPSRTTVSAPLYGRIDIKKPEE